MVGSLGNSQVLHSHRQPGHGQNFATVLYSSFKEVFLAFDTWFSIFFVFVLFVYIFVFSPVHSFYPRPIVLGFFVLQFWTCHFSLETSHIHLFLLFYCFIFLLIVSSLLNCVILVFYPDDGRLVRKLGFYLFGFYPNYFIASWNFVFFNVCYS